MTGRLDRVRRLLAKWFSFAVFGLGCLILTLAVFPVLRLFVHPAARRKRRAQRIISGSFRCFAALMSGCGLFDCRITGRERLASAGRVVVANHPSLIDVVFLVGLMPEVDCIVKRRVWRNPFMAGPVRAAGYISNADGPELIEQSTRALAAGNNLLVFPEGTRTHPGRPLKFQRGAASIAVHAAADIVPVTIRFSEPFLTKQTRWYSISSRKLLITISVDRPISVAPYLEELGKTSFAARKLTGDLLDYYLARLGDEDGLPGRAYAIDEADELKRTHGVE